MRVDALEEAACAVHAAACAARGAHLLLLYCGHPVSAPLQCAVGRMTKRCGNECQLRFVVDSLAFGRNGMSRERQIRPASLPLWTGRREFCTTDERTRSPNAARLRLPQTQAAERRATGGRRREKSR